MSSFAKGDDKALQAVSNPDSAAAASRKLHGPFLACNCIPIDLGAALNGEPLDFNVESLLPLFPLGCPIGVVLQLRDCKRHNLARAGVPPVIGALVAFLAAWLPPLAFFRLVRSDVFAGGQVAVFRVFYRFRNFKKVKTF